MHKRDQKRNAWLPKNMQPCQGSDRKKQKGMYVLIVIGRQSKSKQNGKYGYIKNLKCNVTVTMRARCVLNKRPILSLVC